MGLDDVLEGAGALAIDDGLSSGESYNEAQSIN